LFETQEFKNRQVNRWVQTETTLVWTEGGVELNTVSTVHLDLVLVIFPDDTELDDALWDGGDLECFLVFGVLLEKGRVLEGGGQLWWVVSFCSSLETRFGGDCMGSFPELDRIRLRTRHDQASERPK